MNRRLLAVELAAAGVLLMLSTAPGIAAAIGSRHPLASPGPTFSSAIYSAATNTCVDIPDGIADVNTNAVGSACSGATGQRFSFQPVGGCSSLLLVVCRMGPHAGRPAAEHFERVAESDHPPCLDPSLRSVPERQRSDLGDRRLPRWGPSGEKLIAERHVRALINYGPAY